jgi:hypothetical protein
MKNPSQKHCTKWKKLNYTQPDSMYSNSRKGKLCQWGKLRQGEGGGWCEGHWSTFQSDENIPGLSCGGSHTTIDKQSEKLSIWSGPKSSDKHWTSQYGRQLLNK